MATTEAPTWLNGTEAIRAARSRSIRAWGHDIWLSERAYGIWPCLATLKEVADLKDSIRADHAGPAVVEVTWEISLQFGFPMAQGVVVTREDEAIAAHAWNILPGGGILDAARDRFGWSDRPMVLTEQSPEFLSYRPEWTKIRNPNHFPPVGWREYPWSREVDASTLTRRRQQDVDGWWCTSPSMREALSNFRQEIDRLRESERAQQNIWMPTRSP